MTNSLLIGRSRPAIEAKPPSWEVIPRPCHETELSRGAAEYRPTSSPECNICTSHLAVAVGAESIQHEHEDDAQIHNQESQSPTTSLSDSLDTSGSIISNSSTSSNLSDSSSSRVDRPPSLPSPDGLLPLPTFSIGYVTHSHQQAMANRIPHDQLLPGGGLDPAIYTPVFLHDTLVLPGSLASLLGKVQLPRCLDLRLDDID